MYNHTGLQGRLTADPELRHTRAAWRSPASGSPATPAARPRTARRSPTSSTASRGVRRPSSSASSSPRAGSSSWRASSQPQLRGQGRQPPQGHRDHRLLCPLLRQQEGRGRRRPSGHRRRLRRLPGQLRRLHRGGRQWGLAILNDRRATGGRPKTSQRHATA